ncbi:SnoaL-like protein [Nitrospirillum amazonense]|uniref:SnoaL-like protein n=1 Tax=Nitrospirillum amazonense TaxID=28077 RepID=A0A560FLN8_9PROT|nr:MULTISPECIES: nuclear transport factor 2 family protein [Nitrospirillum]MEA1649611.1 nuclear transport factor 2 family protein [Nitrospirillum sp. BR 11164]TWB22516.1 SnoaL-like protein [Nitrospirillum amazonense]
MMSLTLPSPIAAYFAADKAGADAVAACFTAQAVVKDEGHTHHGPAAIAAWKTAASAKYNYTSTPIAMEEAEGRVVVTSHVAGDFPGSPIALRYAFVVEGGRIASLEITP